MRRMVSLAVAALAMGAAPDAADAAEPAPLKRDVLLVGNNWDGTADVLDVPSYERLRRINIVPDREERLAENLLNPMRAPAFLFVRSQIGEGHDQMVDDLYASNDGRMLFVSRPSFADVVAIDLASGKIVWRRPMTGLRADHMAISPDGTRLAISDQNLTGPQVVDFIDTATGDIVGTAPSGSSPHENVYSRDGNLVFHASIGRVFTATDDPALDATKGERWFEIIDAHTFKVLRRLDMGQKLAEFGMPNMSSAVRPMALSPDERFVYFQVSFFHGFVEYDLQQDKVTRVAHLPVSDEARKLRRDEYVLDSAHHGIAMNGAGTKLCVAGTMSHYAAIVSRETFRYRINPLGALTYWATTSADGKYCYVSVAGDNTMSIISYDSEQEVARVPVGFHPQRARTAKVSTEIFGAPAPPDRLRATSLSLRAQRARGGGAADRLRISGRLALPGGLAGAEACGGKVRLDVRRAAKVVATAANRLRAAPGGCTYARTIRIPAKVARGSRPARLVVSARFAGNQRLLPQRSRQVTLRLA
jgi:DNA-binding beta-propeller fold protein YncE